MPINKAHATRPMAANSYSRPLPRLTLDHGINSGDPAPYAYFPQYSLPVVANGAERRVLNRAMVAAEAYAEDYRSPSRKSEL